MRTTLNLDDGLARLAKKRAAEEGRTLTELFDEALRRYLEAARGPAPGFRFEPLVRETGALPGVRLDDRDALYERMEGRG